jgi:hypothetical protein
MCPLLYSIDALKCMYAFPVYSTHCSCDLSCFPRARIPAFHSWHRMALGAATSQHFRCPIFVSPLRCPFNRSTTHLEDSIFTSIFPQHSEIFQHSQTPALCLYHRKGANKHPSRQSLATSAMASQGSRQRLLRPSRRPRSRLLRAALHAWWQLLPLRLRPTPP